MSPPDNAATIAASNQTSDVPAWWPVVQGLFTLVPGCILLTAFFILRRDFGKTADPFWRYLFVSIFLFLFIVLSLWFFCISSWRRLTWWPCFLFNICVLVFALWPVLVAILVMFIGPIGPR